MSMNTEFASNVHEFTERLFTAMLNEFEGQEVGSDECNLETLMEFHFPDYKPGDKVKKAKKIVDPNKPKRRLSGYTYFGKTQKEEINAAILAGTPDGGDAPKYVETQSKLWKALSDEERAEWGVKAKEAHEDK